MDKTEKRLKQQKMNDFCSLFSRCRERLRLSKQKPDHEGPSHPIYSKFRIRRSLRRICHYYHHPSNPHRRFEEIIDVIAIPTVMAYYGQPRSFFGRPGMANFPTCWEDNSPPSLFFLATKCILANPGVLFR